LGWGSEQQPIAAVLVCSDPTGSDWYQVRLASSTAASCRWQAIVPLLSSYAWGMSLQTYSQDSCRHDTRHDHDLQYCNRHQ
jgi:hypothetical protein